MHRRWHRDDIKTCCHKLKIEKYALKNTPRMSMFILGKFSWRRRPACRLLAACMQGVDAGVQGVNAGRRRPPHGKIRSEKYAENEHVHSRRIFLASTPCMQTACSLHAGRRRRCAGRQCRASTPCTRRRRRECARVFQWRRLHLKRNAACMQAACRLHAECCNLQPPAYDRSYAGCMQPACSLHASLVWHWH